MRPYLTAGLSRPRPADGWRGTRSLFRRPQNPL